MTAPQSETVTREKYLAEANAELDAMLGEVGELEATPAPAPETARTWLHLVIIAVIAVVVFAIGVLLLRGRRPTRTTLNLVR